MADTQDKIEREMRLMNDVATDVPLLLNELDGHKQTTSHVRAWRLNIKRSLSRLQGDNAKQASEDTLKELNKRIRDVSDQLGALTMPTYYNENQVDDYLTELDEREADLKRLRRKARELKTANLPEVSGAIEHNLQVIQANREKALAWKDENRQVASDNEQAVDELNELIRELNGLVE